MIHTPRRGNAPAKLLRYRKRWTDRYASIHSGAAEGDWATEKAKRVIRDSLRDVAHGKCIYCESLLDVTSELTIDHYHAKTVRRDIAFEWTNLLPACRLCNGSKSDSDHVGKLLKPDDENPEPYFWVNPERKLEPHPALDSDDGRRARAEETIRLCHLNRGALCTQRVDAMNRVLRFIDRMILDEWDEWLCPTTQYKLVLSHFLTRHGYPELADHDRQRFLARPN